AGSTAIAPEP
ncbi:hypothetical protein A2U01_0077040, partial [Trifolium medium]|nr:hypothetical protein [Trifolium medium]